MTNPTQAATIEEAKRLIDALFQATIEDAINLHGNDADAARAALVTFIEGLIADRAATEVPTLSEATILRLAHRGATEYKDAERIRYRFSDSHIIDFARSLESEARALPPAAPTEPPKKFKPQLLGYEDCRCILTQYCDGLCRPIFSRPPAQPAAPDATLTAPFNQAGALMETWNAPLHDLQTRLEICAGAVDFERKTVANLRERLAAARSLESEARALPPAGQATPPALAPSEARTEYLCESSYRAGAKAGYNLGVDEDRAGLARLWDAHQYPRPTATPPAQPAPTRKFNGVGELERTGYIPPGSAEERESLSAILSSMQWAAQREPVKVRMLSMMELLVAKDNHGIYETEDESIQRKFSEVNGLVFAVEGEK